MKKNNKKVLAVKIIICTVLVLSSAWLIYRNITVSLEISKTVDDINRLDSDNPALKDILKRWDGEKLARTVGAAVLAAFYAIIFLCVRYVGPAAANRRKRISAEEADEYIKEIEQEYRDKGIIAEAADNYDDEAEYAPSSLEQPHISSVEFAHRAVNIYWDDVDYAEGYIIYRRNDKEDWKKRGKTPAAVTSFEDYSVDSDTTYLYSVRAYLNTDDGRISSALDPIGTEIHVKDGNMLNAPAIFKINDAGGKCGIGWKPVEGAKSYRIYRKNESGDFEIIDKIKPNQELGWYDTVKGVTYTVSAVCSVNKHIVVGKYDINGISIQ